MKDPRLLLCTDLDRTLIPNGEQLESPDARRYFQHLVSHNKVTLVYVTGRHKELVAEAISTYNLPDPDLVISDVGTIIYDTKTENWNAWSSWEKEISPLWSGFSHAELHELFHELKELKLQETHRTSNIKVIDDNTIAINIGISKVCNDPPIPEGDEDDVNSDDDHYENESEDTENGPRSDTDTDPETMRIPGKMMLLYILA